MGRYPKTMREIFKNNEPGYRKRAINQTKRPLSTMLENIGYVSTSHEIKLCSLPHKSISFPYISERIGPGVGGIEGRTVFLRDHKGDGLFFATDLILWSIFRPNRFGLTHAHASSFLTYPYVRLSRMYGERLSRMCW